MNSVFTDSTLTKTWWGSRWSLFYSLRLHCLCLFFSVFTAQSSVWVKQSVLSIRSMTPVTSDLRPPTLQCSQRGGVEPVDKPAGWETVSSSLSLFIPVLSCPLSLHDLRVEFLLLWFCSTQEADLTLVLPCSLYALLSSLCWRWRWWRWPARGVSTVPAVTLQYEGGRQHHRPQRQPRQHQQDNELHLR